MESLKSLVFSSSSDDSDDEIETLLLAQHVEHLVQGDTSTRRRRSAFPRRVIHIGTTVLEKISSNITTSDQILCIQHMFFVEGTFPKL